MVVMNKKGEVVIAHKGRIEMRVRYGKEGITARSTLGYKSFYLYNTDMYIRSTGKYYISENKQFTLVRIERFLQNAMDAIGVRFESVDAMGESFKAAELLMQDVRDTPMTSIRRWSDFDKKVDRLGGWYANW